MQIRSRIMKTVLRIIALLVVSFEIVVVTGTVDEPTFHHQYGKPEQTFSPSFKWMIDDESEDTPKPNHIVTWTITADEELESLTLCYCYKGKEVITVPDDDESKHHSGSGNNENSLVKINKKCTKKCTRKGMLKNTTSIESRLEFGTMYYLKLELKKNGSALNDWAYLIRPVFCTEILLRNEVDPVKAQERCKRSSTGHFKFSSVYDISTYLNYDFNASFSQPMAGIISWKTPLELKQNERLRKFLICKDNGETMGQVDATRIPGDRYFFNLPTPVTENNITLSIIPNHGCGAGNFKFDYAYEKVFVFASEEDDLCIPTNSRKSPCGNYSLCTHEQHWKRLQVPKCECFPGYSGDGFDTSLGGTGCRITCEKQNVATNHTCVRSAVCSYDSHAVSCSCPSGWLGDGLHNGTGCFRLSYIILAVAGVFVVITICAAWVLYALRWKKNRTGELLKETFVAKDRMNSENDEFIDGANLFGKYEVDQSDITLLDVIGRGAFSVVHRATLLKNAKEEKPNTLQVAAKVSNGSRPDGEFLSEISLLITIGHHENISGIVCCCSAGNPILVTEFMIYGDLHNFLLNARQPHKRKQEPIYEMNEAKICKIAEQVACGMDYLRSVKIIHCDLAARNVLIGENLQAKVSDFGLANDVYRYGCIQGRLEKKVPFKWISPERMQGGKAPITWRSDVWSFGILLYEMTTLGDVPFPNIERQDLLERIRKGYRMTKPEECSNSMYQVMRQCWEWTPSKRPSFVELRDWLTHAETPLSESSTATDIDEERQYAEIGIIA